MSSGLLKQRSFLLASGLVALGALGYVLSQGLFSKTTESSIPLVVGTNVWPGYEPLYLARELKYYDPGQIRLAEYSSATQVIRGFRNGTIDVGALTLDEVLLLCEGGVDVCVILVTDISDGADSILAIEEVKDLKDLKGKRIGVENTALGAYVLARALQLAGLKSDQVIIVPREVDEHVKAVKNNEADAVVTFEPVRSQLMSQGFREVFNSSMIPGEVVDVLVVRRPLLQSKSEQLTHLLQGWFRALQYFRENRTSAAKLMAPRLQIKPAEVLESYAGLKLPDFDDNVAFLNNHTPALNQTANRLADVMKDLKLLSPKTQLKNLSSSKVLETLKPFGFTPKSVDAPAKEM